MDYAEAPKKDKKVLHQKRPIERLGLEPLNLSEWSVNAPPFSTFVLFFKEEGGSILSTILTLVLFSSNLIKVALKGRLRKKAEL